MTNDAQVPFGLKQPQFSATPERVASVKHTIRLLCILGSCVASEIVLKSMFQPAGGLGTGHPPMAGFYLAMIISEWVLVWSVWRGMRRHGKGIPELIGGTWNSSKSVAVDVAIATGLWLTWLALIVSASLLVMKTSGVGPGEARAVNNFLPQGRVESILWVAVSLTAGFCEELVFRGYFQRQFHAMTGRFGWAVFLQAVVFGLLHLYQGIPSCLIITLFGIFFGVIAGWRKTLRPGMLAHAWSDIFLGLVVPLLTGT